MREMWRAVASSRAGRIVIVSQVGNAAGAKGAAAALACACSEGDRAALLIDLGVPRAPRPSFVTTAAARQLEERLVAHVPGAAIASRGRICHAALAPAVEEGTEGIAAMLPIARESTVVVHLPPSLLQTVLDEPGIWPSAVLLRADLATDRALTALAVGDLLEREIEVAVLKRSLGWLAERAARLGVLASGEGALPPGAVRRLVA